MTMTTAEAIEAVEAVLAELRAADIGLLAAGDLPPHVAAGELITSAWGNAVVDELARQRAEQYATFAHAGGTTGAGATGAFDNGTTALGPFTYPVRVTAWVVSRFGFNGGGAVTASTDIVPSNGAAAQATSTQQAVTSQWVNVPNMTSWLVSTGSAAGFKTRTIINGNAAGGGCWYAAFGLYHVQRYST